MSKGSMRDQMPVTTSVVDDFRSVFGKEMVDGQIRRGMKGEPVFFASENGHTIGTRGREAKSIIMWDKRGLSFEVNIPAGMTLEEEDKFRKQAWRNANDEGGRDAR